MQTFKIEVTTTQWPRASKEMNEKNVQPHVKNYWRNSYLGGGPISNTNPS